MRHSSGIARLAARLGQRQRSAHSNGVLRVALVTPALDASGGIGRLMGYLLAGLPAERFEAVHVDPRGRRSSPIAALPILLYAWLLLFSLLLRRRVDVVHLNVSFRGSSFRKALMALPCHIFGVPFVVHFHAATYADFWQHLPRFLQSRLRRFFQSAAEVIVLGDHWRDYVCSELGVLRENVAVIPNGVPGPSTWAPRPASTSPPHVLFLGRLEQRKGAADLIAAFASPRVMARPWTATFAGDGNAARYERLASDVGLGKRIAFPGWRSPEEVRTLLARTDFLVLPSYAEGQPLAVIEAMAYGLPVVATDVGSIADAVLNEVTGLLVPAGDLTELCAAIERLLTDVTLRGRLGAQARQRWSEVFTVARFVSAVADCWSRVALRALSAPHSL